jgi:hypothetical protein
VPLTEVHTVAQQFFAALEQEHWDAAAGLVHPDALMAFKSDHVRFAYSTDSAATAMRTAMEGRLEALVAFAPEMAAAIESDSLLQALRATNIALRAFGLTTVAELEALSDQEAFAQWLRAGTTYTAAPRHLIGVLPESDSVSYVVYRKESESTGWSGTTDLRVMTLRHTPAGWRVLPPPRL